MHEKLRPDENFAYIAMNKYNKYKQSQQVLVKTKLIIMLKE